jgi:carbamoyl-phosphate synthase large subunit
MVNCNPETVSTDYDTSDRLYFEPVTLEDVLEIVELEQPTGVIVQFGGQTPLKLARALEAAGVPIIGTTPDQIDRAEDRERFQQMIEALSLCQPANTTVRSVEAAVAAAAEIGYPLVVRPSYVLGGRAMEIVYREEDLLRYMNDAVRVSEDSPVLLDRFLSAAIEVDIDAVSDGEQVVIGAIMQHIEQAGVHSGDSACSLPPYSLPADVQESMRDVVRKMALELGVCGLMNVQLAWQDDEIYVIEVNPRASRTVPFVSKAVGVSLAKVAARCMAGQSLESQGVTKEIVPPYYSVKEAVLPFNKFPGTDPILGPEMKSTGEVMGTGETFAAAFARAQLGAGDDPPTSGLCLISVRDADKPAAVDVAKRLVAQGFTLAATGGTASALEAAGLAVRTVNKVAEGRPHIVDLIKNDEAAMIINTTEGRRAILDSASIRASAEQHKVFYTTTLAAAEHRRMNRVPMTVKGEQALREELERLKKVDRPRITQAIAEAREHGDLKENAEYHAAREQQSFAEGRIQELEHKLSHAQIIDVTTIPATGKVVFGVTVTLINVDDDRTVSYRIVGEDEADAKANLISVNSPIARALVGKMEGDEVTVNAPGGDVTYEIDAVEHL